MNAEDYAKAVKRYDRATREAAEHLETALDTVESFGAGLTEWAKRHPVSAMPNKVADLPLAHPAVQEAAAPEVPARYVHTHNFPRKTQFGDDFAKRVMDGMPEMRKKIALERIRMEASTYPKMSWDDVLMVRAGKPAKQNRRKGNGKGRQPLSLEGLRERELNGKHLD